MSSELKRVLVAGQWSILGTDDGSGNLTGPYRIENPDPTDPETLLFYKVESGQYGQPLIVQEPSLSLPLPANVADKAKPGDRVVGFIVKCLDGKVVQLSLSNARKQKLQYELTDDGHLLFDGKRFGIHNYFCPDRNRMKGLVAFGAEGEAPSANVEVKELLDLLPLLLHSVS